jgi:glucosyl-3-phosphoglycerate synthase
MEYVQDRVATCHDFGDAVPPAPLDRTAVVVPMTEREHASHAAEQVFAALEAVGPAQVIVALRADPSGVGAVVDWLEDFDLPLSVCWCTAPAMGDLLAEAGLGGRAGKGRDVWLALGLAAEYPYVVVHDADATSYGPAHVPRLGYPLANGASFVKGYYARVEHDRLYGRLFRLFYRPLLRALRERRDAPILAYLDSFRYALAGEFAATSEVVRSLRVQRGWGLEVGTLGDAFATAGFEGSAQVDLGIHTHDHRSVAGPAGLGDMCEEVGSALFHALADHGVTPAFDTLAERYERAAETLVDQYALDAGFNDLAFDRGAEREQVATYASAVGPPGEDERLPAWREAPLAPDAVRDCSRRALATER